MTNNTATSTSDNSQIIDPSKNTIYSYAHVENPGLKITSTEFNGHNYEEWSQDFLLALLAKGKSGFLDGTIPKPASTDATYASWQLQNALVTAWLFNTLDSTIKRSISKRPEAKQVWLDIRSRFCQNNDARIYRLQADLVACHQGHTETIMAYYSRLITLWDESSEADPVPSCPCNPCSCSWVSIVDAWRERNKVRDFLIGLDERFDTARSQLLGINPLPTLNLIYNRLLQEESVRSLSTNKPESCPDSMAFATRMSHNPRPSGPPQTHHPRPTKPDNDDPNRPYCIACRRHGHLYPVCFRVMWEFPDW
ncbi:uncharacterized protein LOC141587990 [Silene latifolia]|uniref:uncharacterized protein LOC141587990 n=1 Tax=Silene latifolia TaxID=37657 RepID=UPI003D76B017